MNGDHTESYKTMAEMAKEKGMKVGIISSVSIDHATPACFYAHTESRNNYYTIGQQLTESNFDYFAGGGVRWNKYSGEDQPKDINVFLDAAKANGYKYVDTRSEFEALIPSSGKVIATLEKFSTNTSDGCALPYVVDLDEFGDNDNITLSEFTKKGIELLYDTVGFFMMVEGGKIDWACHANDVVSAAHNTVEFDNAIGVALDFYEQHKDETLIIITGDHECGGLTLGYSATEYETAFDMLNHQAVSYVSFTETVQSWKGTGISFDEAMVIVEKEFGLGDTAKGLGLSSYEKKLLINAFSRSMLGISAHEDEEIQVIYGYYDPFTVTITHILNNKAGIDWTSYSHTGVPVPVFAKGQGQHAFNGYYDNTDIARKIIGIGQLDPDMIYEEGSFGDLTY
jgi:alkaline phosphatase